jgi:beta-galactosidase
VRQAAEVWVNGQSVALSENGSMAFGADITAALRPGENLIAVRVDNDWKYKERATGSGFQWNNNNFNVNYGGITKNVRLHLTGPVYQTLPLSSGLGTTGQYVWADEFDVKRRARRSMPRPRSATPARPRADRLPRRDPRPRRPRGARVSTAAMRRSRPARRACSPPPACAGPALLELGLWLSLHRHHEPDRERQGDRQRRYPHRLPPDPFADGMVTLNGRVIQMHGYAQRTSNEWPAVGVSIPPWLSDFSNGLMVESGGNLVRWMHIAPSKQDVESADRVGLIQAMPAGDAESDVTGRRWEQRKEVMRDAIVYNRNNPSILFYEGGNENISDAHMAELKAIRDRTIRMAAARSDRARCSTAGRPNMAARCSTSTRAPPSRSGRWNIRATRARGSIRTN